MGKVGRGLALSYPRWSWAQLLFTVCLPTEKVGVERGIPHPRGTPVHTTPTLPWSPYFIF